MAVPKRKTSVSKKKMRRSHHRISSINIVEDKKSGEYRLSHHVDLKKRGRNFFGLCPFHNEKTPSFSVAPDKGIYHCFGCGNGGNAINFIMEYEKINFVEALQQLGNQLGIPVEFTGSDDSKEFFSSLYEIHQVAATLYHSTLFGDRGVEAKKYLF